MSPIVARQCGQALLVTLGALCAVLAGVFVLAAVARGIGVRSDAQRVADLAALAGARAMHDAYPRLFEPAFVDGRPNPLHLTKRAYLSLAQVAARDVARRNGAAIHRTTFPDASTFAPVRVTVTITEPVSAPIGRRRLRANARATAEIAPGGADGSMPAAGGGYDGPLVQRQGESMRPDVAAAFDRMSAAARADGFHLIVTSGFRSDAEQAVLWARNPDPRWVAPPGRSLHRLGTELDLGPSSAYGWLAANARRFHFVQRYSWEPWHYGYVFNAASSPPSGARGADGRAAATVAGHGSVPAFVPARFAPAIAEAAQRWNVSATLLAAQLHAESGFNPFARSPAGALGIAQFMPGTARHYGLSNPFDARRAIDAQAHMMRDLLRQFGSVSLALAAYNAGPGRVAQCGCVPPIPETRGYVARILGLMGGAGDAAGAGALVVRLVE